MSSPDAPSSGYFSTFQKSWRDPYFLVGFSIPVLYPIMLFLQGPSSSVSQFIRIWNPHLFSTYYVGWGIFSAGFFFADLDEPSPFVRAVIGSHIAIAAMFSLLLLSWVIIFLVIFVGFVYLMLSGNFSMNN